AEEALRVNRVRAPLQAVKKKEPRASRRTLEMVEDELIAVGGLEDLPNESNLPPRSRQPSPRRLEVRSRQPPRRAEIRIQLSSSQEDRSPTREGCPPGPWRTRGSSPQAAGEREASSPEPPP